MLFPISGPGRRSMLLLLVALLLLAPAVPLEELGC